MSVKTKLNKQLICRYIYGVTNMHIVVYVLISAKCDYLQLFYFYSIWYQEVLYSIVCVSIIEKCVYHFIFELESLLSHSVNITRHFSRKSVDDCNTTNRCEQEQTNIWKKEEKRKRNNKSKSTRTQFNFTLSRSELVFLVLNFVIFILFFRFWCEIKCVFILLNFENYNKK